jgi:hypothetical protein
MRPHTLSSLFLGLSSLLFVGCLPQQVEKAQPSPASEEPAPVTEEPTYLPVTAAMASCSGLGEGECQATPGCEPGYAGICDCTCPGPAGYEGGGCAGCAPGCFVYQACVASPPICPDPSDPAVHYLSHDPLTCQAADFVCQDEQLQFDGECGCGCVDLLPPVCPDPNDPAVHYVSQDPLECAVIDFGCGDEQQGFDNGCGCGCIDLPPASCPDPNDPAVHYLSHDPLVCQAADFVCQQGQQPFDDECGCGCIDLLD